jgi:hypothetical protein
MQYCEMEEAADAGRERHGATDGAGDGREDWQNRAPSCERLHYVLK